MGFIKVNGRDISASHIATIETRRDGLSPDAQSEVFFTLSNGIVLQAFRGTAAACNDYRVAIKTALGQGADVTPPTINWVDFNPKNIVVEKGKVVHTEMMWDGQEAESSAFTYSEGDMSIAEFHLGEVLGADVGTTTISAHRAGKTESGNVRVVSSTDGIMFEHSGAMLAVGGALIIPLKEGGINVPWTETILHSSDPTVATITQSNGQISALKTGDTFIIADYKGKRFGLAIAVRTMQKGEVKYGIFPRLTEEEAKPKRARTTKPKTPKTE